MWTPLCPNSEPGKSEWTETINGSGQLFDREFLEESGPGRPRDEQSDGSGPLLLWGSTRALWERVGQNKLGVVKPRVE
jgi:hypothetical protein